MYDYEKLKEQLMDMKEEKYQEFTSKLLPGVESILGIRIPKLRKMAKQIYKDNRNVTEYLNQVEHNYMEENLLMGFVIGEMSEKHYSEEEILLWIRKFVSYIDNWSVCDSVSTSFKISKRKPELIFPFLLNLYEESVMEGKAKNTKEIIQGKEFTIRFVIVMWLFHFLYPDYLQIIMEKLKELKSDHYYVNMAIAWCYSMIYVKTPERMNTILSEQWNQRTSLDSMEVFVHNKTIRKICESFQVAPEQKNYVKSLRIHNTKNLNE